MAGGVSRVDVRGLLAVLLRQLEPQALGEKEEMPAALLDLCAWVQSGEVRDEDEGVQELHQCIFLSLHCVLEDRNRHGAMGGAGADGRGVLSEALLDRVVRERHEAEEKEREDARRRRQFMMRSVAATANTSDADEKEAERVEEDLEEQGEEKRIGEGGAGLGETSLPAVMSDTTAASNKLSYAGIMASARAAQQAADLVREVVHRVWSMVRAFMALPEFDPAMVVGATDAGQTDSGGAVANEAFCSTLLTRCETAGAGDGSPDDEFDWLRDLLHWIYLHAPRLRVHLRAGIGRRLLNFARAPRTRTVQGVRPLLEVLGHIIRGFQTPLTRAHHGLLMNILIPLHEPNDMVEWRDQLPVLHVYHEPLVFCMCKMLEKEPDKATAVVERLIQLWPSGFRANSPKEVLLLHEVEQLFPFLQKAASLAAVLPHIARQLAACISSDNARVSERALQWFKTNAFLDLAESHIEAVLDIVLPALLRGGQLSWSPTVNKMTALSLDKLNEVVPAAFAAAAERVCGPTAIGSHRSANGASSPAAQTQAQQQQLQQPRRRGAPSRHAPAAAAQPPQQSGTKRKQQAEQLVQPPAPPAQRQLPNAAPARGPMRVTGAVLPPTTAATAAEMGYRQNAGAGAHLGPHMGASVIRAAKSGNPPVTITGVAPWAMQSQAASSSSGHTAGVGRMAALQNRPTGIPSVPLGKAVPGGKAATNRTAGAVETVEEEEEAAVAADAAPSHASEELSGVEFAMQFAERCRPKVQEEQPYWHEMQIAATPTLLPSLRFHDLVFGHDLGTGSFGTVRYARQIVQGKTRSGWPEYAIKVVDSEKIAALGYEKSVIREIAVLQVLAHPGIARMVSSFRFKDGVYMVLEYASRGDLHGLVSKQGSLDEESTRFVCGEILAALTSVHGCGFLYGDLKPENVVITESGHVKLTDFGACRPLTADARKRLHNSRNVLKSMRDGDWRAALRDQESKTTAADTNQQVGENKGNDNESHNNDDAGAEEDRDGGLWKDDDDRIEGTPGYLPPEVLRGASPDFLADAWAYGCVFYYCLAGKPPLYGTMDEISERVVRFASRGNEDELFNPTVFSNPSSKDLVQALMCADKQQRLSVSAAADHAFFSGTDVATLYQSAAPPLVQGHVAPQPDAKWSRRQFSVIWAPMPKEFDFATASRQLEAIAETEEEREAPFLLAAQPQIPVARGSGHSHSQQHQPRIMGGGNPRALASVSEVDNDDDDDAPRVARAVSGPGNAKRPRRMQINFVWMKKGRKHKSFVQEVDFDILAGELVRNACVNLGIDPDTHAGVTRNVRITRTIADGRAGIWVYNPNARIGSELVNGEDLLVEELT